MQITAQGAMRRSQRLREENRKLAPSELMKLQLAWLDQGLDEFEAELRLQSYLDAGFDPDLAAAAVSAELHVDEVRELRARIEQLERTVVLLAGQLGQTATEE
jgi:hypothetical protein